MRKILILCLTMMTLLISNISYAASMTEEQKDAIKEIVLAFVGRSVVYSEMTNSLTELKGDTFKGDAQALDAMLKGAKDVDIAIYKNKKLAPAPLVKNAKKFYAQLQAAEKEYNTCSKALIGQNVNNKSLQPIYQANNKIVNVVTACRIDYANYRDNKQYQLDRVGYEKIKPGMTYFEVSDAVFIPAAVVKSYSEKDDSLVEVYKFNGENNMNYFVTFVNNKVAKKEIGQ